MAWNDFLKSAGNFAYEATGVGDVRRGAAELAKGNVAGGLGRIALGGVGFLPVVGTAARVAATGGRLANAARAVTKGVVPATTKKGQFISSALTSPYTVSRVASQTTMNTPTPTGAYAAGGSNLPGREAIFAQAQRDFQNGLITQQQLAQVRNNLVTPPPALPMIPTGTPGATGRIPGLSAAGGGTGGTGPSLSTGGGTAGTGGAGVTPSGVATPGSVQAEGQFYRADLAAAAARSRGRQVNLADVLSQNIMQARGSAADIYGGRAPAIRGQAITGAQREYVQGVGGETQRAVSELDAIERAYGKAVADAYAAEAKKIKDTATARTSLVAQMKGIG